MNKSKKAKRTIRKTYKIEEYQVICPHCKTILIGGALENKDVLMFLCSYCGKPIDLREDKK